jgi:hypothetical protein
MSGGRSRWTRGRASWGRGPRRGSRWEVQWRLREVGDALAAALLSRKYTVPEISRTQSDPACRADPRGRAAVGTSQELMQQSGMATTVTIDHGLDLDTSTWADHPIQWTEAAKELRRKAARRGSPGRTEVARRTEDTVARSVKKKDWGTTRTHALVGL